MNFTNVIPSSTAKGKINIKMDHCFMDNRSTQKPNSVIAIPMVN